MSSRVSGSDFRDRVEAVVAGLPPGDVATYGEIAAQAGRPGAARAVGNVLAGSTGLPWWRVITATGRLVPGMEAEHSARLAAEGVAVEHDHVSVPLDGRGT